MRRLSRWVFALVGSLALVALAACGGKGSGSDPCGDGVLDTAEGCDDDNTDPGDGCDDQCQVETGWSCDGEPSLCAPLCGDGLVRGGEACDDGNTIAGDGCDDQCTVESGWTCNGEPSLCDTVCGDDIIAGEELCDGNDLADQTCASLGLGDGTLACGADCLFDVTGCPVTPECGNDVREYPEACDATDLAGEDCASLGFAGGDLDCTGDCTFDTSGCEAPVVCGDDVAGAGEACDGSDLNGETCQTQGYTGGTLACAGDCTFDVTSCTGTGPTCGNDVREGTEQCDGVDLAGATCVSLGHVSGTLDCTAACTFDETQCVDCGPGLTLCGTECVDVLNDPDYCGNCVTACTAPNICVGGQCSQPGLAWVDVGTQPLGPGTAHDLATDGAQPTVAYTQPNQGGVLVPQVIIERYSGAPAWDTLGDNPAQLYNNLNSAVALTYEGGVPHVLFSATDWSAPGSVHVYSLGGATWSLAAPSWISACMAHEQVAMAFDATGPHIVTFGAGGCGLGTDYAWFDGTAWQSHPSTTGFPAQLTMNGNGYPDLVYTDQAYVGLPETGGMTVTAEHHVRYWDGGAWASLAGPLDENNTNGWNEHLSLVADSAGNLYAAWSEGTPGGGSTIYVKRYDLAAQTWSLVGGGQPEATLDAYEPHITLIGTVPWVTYARDEGMGQSAVIVVKRLDGAANTWQQIGDVLTDGTPAPPGHEPVILGIGGIPFVAMRVNDVMTIQQQVWVQHYVPTP